MAKERKLKSGSWWVSEDGQIYRFICRRRSPPDTIVLVHLGHNDTGFLPERQQVRVDWPESVLSILVPFEEWRRQPKETT